MNIGKFQQRLLEKQRELLSDIARFESVARESREATKRYRGSVQIGRNLDTEESLISAVTRVSPAATTEQENY
jgi:hypothetical protein